MHDKNMSSCTHVTYKYSHPHTGTDLGSEQGRYRARSLFYGNHMFDSSWPWLAPRWWVRHTGLGMVGDAITFLASIPVTWTMPLPHPRSVQGPRRGRCDHDETLCYGGSGLAMVFGRVDTSLQWRYA